MKILVLGSTGMLGSAVVRVLGSIRGFQVIGSRRTKIGEQKLAGRSVGSIYLDALQVESVREAISLTTPNWVVNCIGAVKQLAAASEPVTAITLNALFPHQVAEIGARHDAKVIHFSTDCVFSGSKGMYIESDLPDARDLYGRSKLLGELTEPNCLTLRTSMIGPELDSNHSLLEWYLSQITPVKGYRRAVFSGLTTYELAKLVAKLIQENTPLRRVYHVAAEPIDKFTLLNLIRATYGIGAKIIPDDAVAIDRSLDGSRFREAAGYTAPSWPQMISEMRANDDRRKSA